MDRSLVAAVASGWIESDAPPALQDGLFQDLDAWTADGGQPVPVLWLSLMLRLDAARCRDGEISACRTALSLMPDQHYFRYRLARALHHVGDDPAALAELEPLAAMAAVDADLLALRLEIAAAMRTDTVALLSLTEAWFAARPEWSAQHGSLIRILIALGAIALARRLMTEAVRTAPTAIDQKVELARLAMLTGDYVAARRLFTELSSQGIADLDLIVGRFGGTVAPYTPDVENAIRAAMAAARALPDAALASLPPSPCPPITGTPKVVLVGFESTGFPNDMAHHLVGSGRAAGLDISAYLDNALTMAHEVRATDAWVEARVEAFEAEMECRRPDVILVDWAAPLTARGLSPERLAELKHRLGFRLIVGMRDAHAAALDCMTRWLAAVDTLLLYHPLSPIIAVGGDTVFVGWLPVHLPALARTEGRDLNLSFVGSVAFTLRNALLSVLLTEDLPFTAIIGERRKTELPDMAAYLSLLGRSRATLNISAHTHDEHLVTGRVWESIAMETLLVEQDNPATASYFTPWRHYLPWRSVDDIAHICRFVERNPAEVAAVAAEAHAWAARHYSAERFWRGLMAHAMRND
ncbi:hypothetical protein CU669_15525 [Paramagnetospirillum kuznetsovii]|uniref:Spore protein YkvP/CgeB glycosyl transferase-like domain-containing protein n=1 Tax=Paramagnetospirillum kuznetsovii TaxID=2053833 RepID=A0A364NV82_9PROT|nr:glycosyltransferase [Paramagnetospirillum kuznetsovii]RAU20994.1 hypothetical protein CU669_15525 [Paramagnetospirillum kuznetsovii]